MAGQTLNIAQKALYQRLTGNPSFMNLVGSVYDIVPENSAYPYLVFRTVSAENIESLAGNKERSRFILQFYTRDGGRKSLQVMMDAAHILLHRAAPALEAGYELYSMECNNAETQLLPDGVTWQGKLEVKAVVKKL